MEKNKKITINSSIRYLKGVGPSKSVILSKLGIYTINDLLHFFPKRYEDRTKCKKIINSFDGETILCSGIIISIKEKRIRRRLNILEIIINDGTENIYIPLFNQIYLKKNYHTSDRIFVYGKVRKKYGKFEISSASIDKADNKENFGLVPVYALTEGLYQKWIRKLIYSLFDLDIKINSIIPDDINLKRGFKDKLLTLRSVHFPKTKEEFLKNRYQLVFEELFLMQLLLLWRKNYTKNTGEIEIGIDKKTITKIEEKIPFNLTDAQKRVSEEIFDDLILKEPMLRLLQGDVGSGKTIVAFISAIAVIKKGFQVALLAPTEILAEQHFLSFKNFLSLTENKVNSVLLTGKLTVKNKKIIKEDIKKNKFSMIIGTHAIIQKDVVFNELGLAIIDEQHKFGIDQRMSLIKKGNPNVLVMTATPIPRTTALTVYGDLDISIIDEFPKGRIPVRSFIRKFEDLSNIYNFIKSEVKKGRQAFIVCPLVNESEKKDWISAKALYDELKNGVFKDLRVGLLYGSMNSDEKTEVFSNMRNNRIDVLVSTTVVEVGVNLPKATVIVIKNSERFGLSQLHQIRGRVGRSNLKSYCIFITGNDNLEIIERLNILCKTTDGFEIAEQDLRLRGPGEFFGSNQHGLTDLKIADIFKDIKILNEARIEVSKIFANSELLIDYTKLKSYCEKHEKFVMRTLA